MFSDNVARAGRLSEPRAPQALQGLFETIADERPMKAGAALIHERGPCDSLYLLTDGWALRYATTREGARQISAILLPGDFCNLDSLTLDRLDYGVRMLTSGKVLSLPRGRLAEFESETAGLDRYFLRCMALENARLARAALCLGRKSAQARLAHFLCELATRVKGAVIGDGARFELPLTQEQIADALGLTSVHVNRTFRYLVANGLIQKQGHFIDIPSFEKLSEVGEFDATYLHRGNYEIAEWAAPRPAHAPSASPSAAVQ